MQMDLTNEHCGYSKKASKNMGEMDHIAHLNNSRNVFSIQDISGTTCSKPFHPKMIHVLFRFRIHYLTFLFNELFTPQKALSLIEN